MSESVPTEYDEIDVDALGGQVIDEIERPRQADATMDNPGGYLEPGILPSFGERDGCGEDEVHYFCAGCGDVTPVLRTCYRSQCPRCAPMWNVQRSTPNLARLQTVAKTMSARLGPPDERISIKKSHLVMIPPEDWYLAADDTLDRTFEVISEIMDVLHAEGIVLYHGYRGKNGDDRGAWKPRLNNDRSWDDVRSELVPEGHFHVVCAWPSVTIGDAMKRVEEETGWIIEWIRDLSLEQAAESLVYDLSHTSLIEQNGQMQAQYRRYGSIWHDSSVNVYNHTTRKAERAVRSVAPRLLGVAPAEMRCESSVERGEGADERIDRGVAYDGSGSTDGSGNDCEDCDDDHSSSEITCKGALHPIWEADDLLEDDEWLDEAPYAGQLVKAFEEWQSSPGLDRPPPMIDAL